MNRRKLANRLTRLASNLLTIDLPDMGKETASTFRMVRLGPMVDDLRRIADDIRDGKGGAQ